MVPQRLDILCFNQSWFSDELVARGHRVVTVGAAGRGFHLEYVRPDIPLSQVMRDLPTSFNVDRVIYFDDSAPIRFLGFEELTVPTVFYSVDTHHHLDWHKYFGRAFDKMFVAQRDYVEKCRQSVAHAEWLPLWAPTLLKPETDRPIDVSFRGNFNERLNPERVKFFETLKQQIDVDACMGDYRTVYPRSKIVINQAVKGDFNFRVLEALVSGALLITPHVDNGMLELFEDGVDLITYRANDVSEALEKIRYFLANEQARERVALSGCKKVLAYHTAERRAERLESCLLDLEVGSREGNAFGLSASYLVCAEIWRKGSEFVGAGYVKRAVDKLTASLASGEAQRESNLDLMIMTVKTVAEEWGDFPLAFSLMRQVCDTFPGHQVFERVLADVRSRCEAHIRSRIGNQERPEGH